MKLFIIFDTEYYNYVVLADNLDHAFEQINGVPRNELMLYEERELDKPGVIETFHIPPT